jgi:hypothetical protein
MHILLVEDHRDSAAALARVLERNGYTVTRAQTLAEARTRCRRQLFALLLCDISLPDGDGWRFLWELREACLDVPAIAVTALSSEADKQRSLDAGYAAHVSKPIQIDGLLQVIQWVIGRSLPAPANRERPETTQ